MKKLAYFLTAACAIWVLSSCEDKKDPVYHAPTAGSFSLYNPAMQDQYIELSETGTLELTTSGQPDYGYSAVAVYGAQMSLTGDFSDETAVYDLSPVDTHQSKITLKQNDVALGVCALLGLESQDDYDAMFPNGFTVMPLYFRASCQLNGVAGSEIISNVVSYNNILPFFAVASPGYIYMIGDVSGSWIEPSAGNAAELAQWRLFEPDDAIGSKIYSGVFTLPANPYFRFYTALTGWDDDSYGYQEADNATDFPEFTGGSWTGKLIKGKGAYNFSNFAGGEVTIIVDMSVENNMTVTVTSGAVEVFVPKYIYAIGSFTDPSWMEPSESNADAYEPYKLFNSASAKAVYTGSFEVKEGDLYIRFAYELLGWDDGQWGYKEADESTAFDLVNNSFSSPYVKGKGAWEFSLPSDGNIEVAVDTDNETATFTFVPAGEAEE